MINLEKEIREQPDVLANISKVNKSTVEALVAKAKAAGVNNICFAARGTSDHASIYAQYLFGIFASVPCGLATPSVISQYGAKINYKDTLVIGVSQSGQAADVLSVIRDAKECGAITASVTNNADSPLAKEADYHLFCDAGPEVSIAATKTFTSQMYLLAMICAEWSGSDELQKILDKVPETVAEVLDKIPGRIEQFIGDYKDLEYGVVLGRGVVYPIALEGTLKNSRNQQGKNERVSYLRLPSRSYGTDTMRETLLYFWLPTVRLSEMQRRFLPISTESARILLLLPTCLNLHQTAKIQLLYRLSEAI